jgi:hypothetical protein
MEIILIHIPNGNTSRMGNARAICQTLGKIARAGGQRILWRPTVDRLEASTTPPRALLPLSRGGRPEGIEFELPHHSEILHGGSVLDAPVVRCTEDRHALSAVPERPLGLAGARMVASHEQTKLVHSGTTN